ncbi:hypothetical protein MCU_01440 [Bartonella elizabethae Re6043vi]|uniref:DUF1376 domain-containing protein n=2 Tax=Bartonella elizabethae TaxID=807 RepID=J0ZWR1_BAREL|nr:DUF1376 domain-containing protein [Bartonella elizabethae]EJF82470.1 hypothetical protein MCU_01440 [Bartonella elizabethae Re6043vi]EJF93453.1 hypothetical protein MEE_01479 [Bartonella elizabethae F9251 = ATCC 49927]VEJ41858.1 Uncharacterized protein conserved in bacteria [Bartonella elizabethae]
MKHVNQQETPHYESSRLPYVCWYQNDFLGGVRGMRAHEIGIYTILLNEMYARGRPLEISEERLARLCGCDKRTFVNVLGMLIREGKILNLANGLWNARCENVFQEREKLLEQKSFAGRSSAKKRKKINTEIQQLLHARTKDDQQNLEAQKAEEEKETPNGVFEKNRVFDEKEEDLSSQENLEQSAPPPALALSASLAETKHENGTATALQAGARETPLTAIDPKKNTKKPANCVSSSFSTSPSSPCSNKKNIPSSIVKGHRLPETWQADIKAAISEGLSESQAHWQAKKFRDYWQAKSGKEALKVDWQATWRNWFRREIERLEQQKQESVSPRPCASDENLYRSLINYSDDC